MKTSSRNAASTALGSSEESADREADPLFVNSVEKALRLLYAFQEGGGSLGLTELAERTGMGASATQRFAHTWTRLGYLRKDPRSRRYLPGAKLLDFSALYLQNDMLVRMALPYLVNASEESEESSSLCELEGTDVIHVLRVVGKSLRPVTSMVGKRMPAFCSAGGRAMLAFRPQDEVRALLEASDLRPRTPTTLTHVDDVLAALERVRRDGYALVDKEMDPGELVISAPVIGHDGWAVAAVNLPVASSRWSVEDAREKLAPVVLRTARAISHGEAR